MEMKWGHEVHPNWDSTGTIDEAYSSILGDGREVTVYRTGCEWAWFDGQGHSEGPYRSRNEAAAACMRGS